MLRGLLERLGDVVHMAHEEAKADDAHALRESLRGLDAAGAAV